MPKPILNLTQHVATDGQIAAGVREPTIENKFLIKALLTFQSAPTMWEKVERANDLADIVREEGFDRVMADGEPFFVSTLEHVLAQRGIKVKYAFSKRESIDIPQPDGTVYECVVFKFINFC
jgi:hypothetical protein